MSTVDFFETKSDSLLLNEHGRYLESIIDNSYDGIFITDCDGIILKANESYERITDIKKEDIIGKNINMLVEEGLLSAQITERVVKEKRPITITQTVGNGKNIIITGSPIIGPAGNVEKVITNVRDITELITLEKKLSKLQALSQHYEKALSVEKGEQNIVCQSEAFKNILEQGRKAAMRDSTVLILGETGVGKEVVARHIHETSPRHHENYIQVNCAAIPPSLIESELFGYTGGAFTGANPNGKVGMFELADKGTIFLDEIGELPINLQASLLRVIQEGEFMKIGSTKIKKIDVRIIAATNRNLDEMMANGSFRSDLYYRLNVVSILIPPLRDRTADINPLAEHFVSTLNKKYHENKVMTTNFIEQLRTMSWPGNVRELKNFIEKQFVMSDENIMDVLGNYSESVGHNTHTSEYSADTQIESLPTMKEALENLEKSLLKTALERGKTTYGAAQILGMSQPTFFRRYKHFFPS